MKRTLAAVAAVAFASLELALAAPTEVRLTPDSRVASAANRLPVMESGAFAYLALVASGADDAEIDSLAARLGSLAQELRARVSPDADERAKGEAILALMYDRALSRYSETQTRLDVALKTGDYNCVSSAIIFTYLAKTAALTVEGVETPDHAFCTVEAGGAKIDVETTNPYGFDPGNRKELLSESATQKKYAIVPQTKYRNRKPIDDRRLIALVYNNRISALEKRGDFGLAIGLAIDAWELQGGEVPLGNLAERFLNYAISLSRSGKEAEGLEFIRTVAGIWGDYPDYRDFTANSAGSLLNALMKKGDYAASFEILARYKPMLDAARYREMTRGVTVNYLQLAVEESSLADALAKIEASRQDLGAGDYERLAASAYSREADRVSRNGTWLEAAAVLDEGLRLLPAQSDLAQQRTAYRQNHAIEAHNRAAAAYNAGKADEARAIVTEGLQAVPESALLKNDLKAMR